MQSQLTHLSLCQATGKNMHTVLKAANESKSGKKSFIFPTNVWLHCHFWIQNWINSIIGKKAVFRTYLNEQNKSKGKYWGTTYNFMENLFSGRMHRGAGDTSEPVNSKSLSGLQLNWKPDLTWPVIVHSARRSPDLLSSGGIQRHRLWNYLAINSIFIYKCVCI